MECLFTIFFFLKKKKEKEKEKKECWVLRSNMIIKSAWLNKNVISGNSSKDKEWSHLFKGGVALIEETMTKSLR